MINVYDFKMEHALQNRFRERALALTYFNRSANK